MLRAVSFALAFFALQGSAPRPGQARQQPAEPVTAITHVTVVPMNSEGAVDNQTVVIAGQRIAAIGPAESTPVPEGAVTISGRGRFLMPGLSDMHAHLRWKKGHMPQDYISQGITVVRNMAGEDAHLKFRQSVIDQTTPGPLFSTTGQPLTSSEFFPSHRMVKTAEEGEEAVREQFEQGYDYVKVYSLLSPDAFEGVARAANRLGMPIVGHVSDAVGLRASVTAGMSSVEHFFGYFWELESETSDLGGEWDPRRLFHAVQIDSSKLEDMGTWSADSQVWNCPTLWRKNNFMTAPSVRKAWKTPKLRRLAEQNRLLLLKALHDSGAGLLTGTDDRAEIIHDELALFVEAGLTPYEALRASTWNAARYLDATADFGSVEVGKLANLVLLRESPLDDVGNTRKISGVMMRGVWYPQVPAED